MLLTKFSSYYFLIYVLYLCHLLNFIMTPWVDPLLRHSLLLPFLSAFEAILKRLMPPNA